MGEFGVLPLSEYIPLFPTKAEAKRYRKQVIEHVRREQEHQAAMVAEYCRILASFGKREPAQLGDDFIARWAAFNDGGTAIRRKIKRELKKKGKEAKK